MDRRSRQITEGASRAGARAMLRAVGFTDADFAKPIVGVANGYSNVTPCNVGIDGLARRAEAALKSAGAMPQVFGTITVSDGISMGTEGDEVLARVPRGHRGLHRDRVQAARPWTACSPSAACDKNMPGAMIAIARMNIPAIFVYGGTIKPGHLGGRDLTIVSVFEAIGAARGGQDRRGGALGEVERNACPGAGACGGMFTANTMSSAIEAMGMSLPGSSTMAAEDAEKAESAARSARGAPASAVRAGPAGAADPDPGGLRERDRGGDGGGRLDERGPAPAGHRPRRRAFPSRSTTSRPSARACPCCATSSRPAASSRRTCTARGAFRR